ncbi:MAG: Hsp70 family protein [Desulfosudaceae bacterium]
MTTIDKLYAVGIDLGTTNSAVAYARLEAEAGMRPAIQRFSIPQLTGSGKFSRLPVLPSFLYLPGEYEISEAAIAHPWRMPDKRFAGSFARDFGANIPARLAMSAKSWLCEKDADRTGRILPWGAPDEVGRVSPVEASAAYLAHIRNAWNHACGEEEEEYLENQLVTVTVPASFNEVARDLTLEAAAMAGLNEVVLLEEPLAAFYSWLTRHEKDWADLVSPGELILVCDVGGGTTDLTLITLRDGHGTPRFERIAVGDHLILGGDNMDLALAREAEARMGRSLSADQLKTLCHLCRRAKERLLENPGESERLTLMGEGSSLIAGTLSADLAGETVRQIVLEHFFPLEPAVAEEEFTRPKGRSEFGLSYENVSAITAHISQFLRRHEADTRRLLSRPPVPDLILFNGGALQPGIIQERIRKSVCQAWAIDASPSPRVMDNPVHDAAVSIGAAYYGLVKAGQGVRVGSGSPRSFYLGVNREADSSEGEAGLCVVERGVDEGTLIELPEQRFEVVANRQVSFNLYSSSFRSGDRHGDLIALDDSVIPLSPVQTVVQFGEKGQARNIPVQIEAEYTELGTLVLWCRSLISPHRWQLQFQLRETAAGLDMPATGTTLEDAVVARALETVTEVLAHPATDHAAARRLAGLAQEVAGILELPKEKWPLSFLRALADALIVEKQRRKISAAHETRWLNLAGFAARPGIGDGFDGQRVKALWRIYNRGLCFPNQAQVKNELWILVRRIACGLKPGQQRQFLQDVSPLILPRKNERPKVSAQEAVEIWMALANMERLLVKDKIACGRALLSLATSKKGKPQHLWVLSRLGAREMLYGSADRVIPPDEAAGWAAAILSLERLPAGAKAAAVTEMVRRTGDRTRDVEQKVTDRVLAWLEAIGLADRFEKMVREVVPVTGPEEESGRYGESLPAGLILRT